MSTTVESSLPPLARYRLPLAEAAPPPAVLAADPAVDAALWRHNALWFCRLRWWVVGLLLAAGLLGRIPPVVSALEVPLDAAWPWAAAAVLAGLNAWYLAALRGRRAAEDARTVRRLLRLEIVVDLAVLTAVIHCAGSAHPAVPLAYLFHIVLACIFFSARQSVLVLLAAMGLYLGLLGLEAAGLPAPAGAQTAGGRWEGAHFWMVQVLPMLAAWTVIWYLASRLSAALRRREAELALANQRLEAGVEERFRHMLQTTHQLKAPFAAIHANAQLLLGGTAGPLGDAARDTVQRIAARAATLSQMIVDMLQLANLRSAAQSAPPPVPLDVAELLAGLVGRLQPAAALRGIRLQTRLEPSPIAGVEDHMKMLLENLLANAVNYSFDRGVVTVECGPAGPAAVRVAIADEGIGIAADKLPSIFEDYYRTKEAARHNKASTGLGLAIVRDLCRMWQIAIEVESAPGRGTRFTLEIPRETQAAVGRPPTEVRPEPVAGAAAAG